LPLSRSDATADIAKLGSTGPVRTQRAWRRMNAATLILIVVAAIVAYLALVPLATLLISSFQSGFLSRSSHWTLGNFQHFLSSPIFYRLLGTSLIYALCTALAATVMGVGLGWLYARSDMPVVAVAIHGTRAVLPPGGVSVRRSAIRVEILEVLTARDAKQRSRELIARAVGEPLAP